jgi:DNA-binding response OmpR family regulator
VLKNKLRAAKILVVADDEEIRDGIEMLLRRDGYQVNPTRNEEDAIDTAIRIPPDLILVSLDRSGDDATATARRVRARAGLSESIPIVMFCIVTFAEGAEVEIGANTYATWPDDFDQLRAMLSRLVAHPAS